MDSRAQGERHLPNPLSQQGPFPLGNHPASQVNGASAPTSNGSAGRRSVSSHPSEGHRHILAWGQLFIKNKNKKEKTFTWGGNSCV